MLCGIIDSTHNSLAIPFSSVSAAAPATGPALGHVCVHTRSRARTHPLARSLARTHTLTPHHSTAPSQGCPTRITSAPARCETRTSQHFILHAAHFATFHAARCTLHVVWSDLVRQIPCLRLPAQLRADLAKAMLARKPKGLMCARRRAQLHTK